MRLTTSASTLTALAALAVGSSAHPDLNVLSPLANALSTSPLFALQTGLAQYSGLLSPNLYSLLSSRLSVLPARAASLTAPLQKAFAAAQLAATDANGATLNDAQACLNDILIRGSIPTGYACVFNGKDTLSRYRTAANTVLEQFVGIVPPATLSIIQDDFTAYFNSLGLIPPVIDLNQYLQNVLASVVASTSGETVTAVEQAGECLERALTGSKNIQLTYDCFATSNGPVQHLENILNGVLQQFVGYLPPNAAQSIINIYSYYLWQAVGGGTKPSAELLEPMDNAMLSVVASASGNTVTATQQLIQCFNDLIMLEDDARSTYTCLLGSSGPVRTVQVLVNGILQQGFGYLPPTLVLQLEQDLRPLLTSTTLPAPSLIDPVFQSAFQATAAGPETVTCALAVEDCLNAASLAGAPKVCELEGQYKALVQ
ncbi:hypothetical protein JCM8097_005804 [Rhodosporidiobolus ruineniae]